MGGGERARRGPPWGAACLVAAGLLVACDVATLWGSPWISTHAFGGTDVFLSGGNAWVRNGRGFMREGKLEWNPPEPFKWRRWWFGTSWYSISGALNWRETNVPLWHLWAPMVGAAVIAGPVRRRLRRRRGLCEGCGYSREGITGACPECGWAV